jgi:hypothetical protein
MKTTTIFVVGDRCAAFAEQTGARTVSGLVRELRAGVHQDALVLAEGQGVTGYDWELIRHELERAGLFSQTRIATSERGRLAGRSQAHKHHEQNVLIAGLSRTGETTFRAELRVHNDQELQLDHQASHVQGMVILEAARQMFLAVCESYYSPLLPELNPAYVYDRLECRFQQFLFPLDGTIECEVLTADLSRSERLVFDIHTTFHQAGAQVAAVRMTGSALDRERLLRKEARSAQQALRHAIGNLLPGTELLGDGLPAEQYEKLERTAR